MSLLKRIRFRIENKLYAPSRRMTPSLRSDPAPRALLLACYDPDGLGAMRDFIAALVAGSRLRIDVLNLLYCPIRRGAFELPADVDLAPYDCLIFHSTACYNPDHLFALDARRKVRISDFQGVKVMLKQDEQLRTGRFLEFLDRAGLDVLATCLDEEEARRVYDPARRGFELMSVLPGYVASDMLDLRYEAIAQRPIDVGYRGSPQQWNFGRLAYEKLEIGERFSHEAMRHGLRVDISSRWEDRFFGRHWLDFLGRCKATLGVESGASLFDFTGEIEAACTAYLQTHPQASFEDVQRTVLAPHDGNVRYRTLSPRHFEAAACRTLQIMYEGHYRGIFLPWRHYVPLRRDFANLDEVLKVLRDPDAAQQIVDTAFREIVANPAYSFASFVASLDERIFNRLAARGRHAA